jgi:PDZ domain/Aspartyl protease
MSPNATLVWALITAGCSGVRGSPLPEPVVIPFELRGDFALVRVEVNGFSTTLILDSGSGALVLDSSFARVAGIVMSPFMKGRAEGNRTTSVEIGNAREVRLGAAELSNVRVASLDFRQVQARVGYDVMGALGYEVFERYVVAIDYRLRRVTLYEPATFEYHGSGAIIPLTIQRNLPVVAASIVTRSRGTIPAKLHLDLGSSSYALRLASGFVARHGIDRDTITVKGLFGSGVGGDPEGLLLRIPRLTLGQLSINRPSTALSRENDGAFGATSATDGTIGVPVFRRTRLILDYTHSRAILDPEPGFELPDSVDASGLTLGRDTAGARPPRVVYVVSGSAASIAGITDGDELLSVDGVPVASRDAQRATDLLRSAGKTRLLLFRRGRDTVAVALHLRMII